MKAIKGLMMGVACCLVAGSFGFLCVSAQSVLVDGNEYKTKTLETDLTEYVRNTNQIFDEDALNQFVTYTVDVSSIRGQSWYDRLIGILTDRNYTLRYEISFDVSGIEGYLTAYNETATVAKNAEIVKADVWELRPEEYGTQVDIEALVADLDAKDAIKLSDYYVQPEVVSADLQELFDTVDKYQRWYIKYTEPEVQIVSSADCVDIINGAVILDNSFIEEQFPVVTKTYNTVGKPREFTKVTGETIILEQSWKATWGSIVDEAAELEALKSSFSDGVSSENREPIYKTHYEDIGDFYIEASILAQHVWVIKDGVVIKESDMVSGRQNKYDTPTGHFYILNKAKGVYLRGADYCTWVDRWMRITYTGVGLHDATWRAKFGGSIYKTNGSHGCLNLPKSFAYWVYENAPVGTPVVIY